MYCIRIFIFLVIFALAQLTTVQNVTGPIHGKAVVCVIGEKTIYPEDRSQFQIENTDGSLCTHIIGIDEKWLKSENPWQDSINQENGLFYEQITNLREKFPHLKVLLGVNLFPAKYLEISNDRLRRRKFIKDATNFVVRYGFDGLNLNWDYSSKSKTHHLKVESVPMENQMSTKEMIVLLFHELKESFHSYNRFLTSSFTGTKEQVFAAHNLAGISEYVDFINVVPISSTINQNAINPFESLKMSDVDDIINSLMEIGLSQSKIVMQVSFLGTIIKLNLNNVPKRHPMGYNEICIQFGEMLQMNSSWNLNFIPETSLLIAKHTHDGHSIVFESGRSIVRKVRFAMQRNLIGIVAYLINADDSLGNCGIESDTFSDFIGSSVNISKTNVTFPLLRTINESIFLALKETCIIKQPAGESKTKPQDHMRNFVFGAFVILLSNTIIIHFLKT